MRLLFALLYYSLLLAIGKKSTHWYIDGNNLLGHGKTAKDREALMQTLRNVPAVDLTLVFDGRPGMQQTSILREKNLCTVDLGEGLASDDYIHDEIQKYWEDSSTRKKNRVNLVSADRKLRQRALQFKPIVRTVVNPLVFFRRYLPRLSGLKKPKISSDESD